MTAGGLVFIGASDERRFRAFNAKISKEVWIRKMNASGSSTPSSYYRDQRYGWLEFGRTGGIR